MPSPLSLAPALLAQVQQPGQLPSPDNSEPLSVGAKDKLALSRGQGWEAFGVRLASGFEHLVKEPAGIHAALVDSLTPAKWLKYFGNYRTASMLE